MRPSQRIDGGDGRGVFAGDQPVIAALPEVIENGIEVDRPVPGSPRPGASASCTCAIRCA